MATYQSIIAYDGTEFAGFQRLAIERRTVQGVLEDALRAVGWTEASLLAAGRTDRGVHARGQVIGYGIEWPHPPEVLTRALNARLPRDVAVRSTGLAPSGWHPRFSARRRRYTYRAFVSQARDPLRERFAWRWTAEPDHQALQQAADLFLGRHDFGAFGHAPIEGGHTVRSMFRSTWEFGQGAEYTIEADAFLYRMVRRLVGAMAATAAGDCSFEDLQAHLADPSNRWERKPAPAHGLCLEAVIYENMDTSADAGGSG
jgi:tRNA pseudouridine38-40 synthase